MNEPWNLIKVPPENKRFVKVILENGLIKEARWIEKPNSVRNGKQWVDRDGKFVALTVNPAVDWEELDE